MDTVKISGTLTTQGGKDCIQISLPIWDKKTEAWPNRKIWIPIDAIPDLISVLCPYNESLEKPTSRQSKKGKNQATICEKLIGELKAYLYNGTTVIASYNNCRKKYEQYQASLKDQQKWACYSKKCVEHYENLKRFENVYNSKIHDYTLLFDAVKGDLACFAGCNSSDAYETLFSSLLNKKRHVAACLVKNANLLDAIGDIPPFPQYTEPTFEETGGDTGDFNDYNSLPEHLKTIKLVTSLQKETAEANNADMDLLKDLCNAWEQQNSNIANAKNYYNSEAETYVQQSREAQAKCEEYKQTAKLYLTEARKKMAFLNSHKKEWFYYRLLQAALPLMIEIGSLDDDIGSEKAVSLYEKAWDLLRQFNSENEEYQFQWITPTDDIFKKSKRIRVDFIAGEANWPGLYLSSSENADELICVSPGYVFDE